MIIPINKNTNGLFITSLDHLTQNPCKSTFFSLLNSTSLSALDNTFGQSKYLPAKANIAGVKDLVVKIDIATTNETPTAIATENSFCVISNDENPINVVIPLYIAACPAVLFIF